MDEELEEILEEKGVSSRAYENAVAVGRKLGVETGLCCEDLAKVVWWTVQQFTEGGEEQ